MSRPFLPIAEAGVLEQHAEGDERHAAGEHGYFCSRDFVNCVIECKKLGVSICT